MTPTPNDVQPYRISRSFSAARSRVWQAWSEADQFSRWWGPKGCTLKLQTMQFQVGGTLHYAMQWPGVPDMWGKFVFTDIAPEMSLSYISSFSNADGDVTRAPFPGMDAWPLEIANTVTFTEHDGTTTLALQASPLRANDAEQALFSGFFGSMNQGFGGTLDQLDGFLTTPR